MKCSKKEALMSRYQESPMNRRTAAKVRKMMDGYGSDHSEEGRQADLARVRALGRYLLRPEIRAARATLQSQSRSQDGQLPASAAGV